MKYSQPQVVSIDPGWASTKFKTEVVITHQEVEAAKILARTFDGYDRDKFIVALQRIVRLLGLHDKAGRGVAVDETHPTRVRCLRNQSATVGDSDRVVVNIVEGIGRREAEQAGAVGIVERRAAAGLTLTLCTLPFTSA